MRQLNEEGAYDVSPQVLQKLKAEFACGCCDDAHCGDTIGKVWREHRYLCDPHTAVAWAVADAFAAACHDGAPVVVLSTASPYKFPAAVLHALGREAGEDEFAMMAELHRLTGVPVPAGLAGLQEKEVRHSDVIDKEDMLDYVLRFVRG